MFAILLVIHVLLAVVMVISILLQSGQGGGLSGAFGGGGGGGGGAGGSQSLFGGRGAATFLSKATAYLGAGFMVVSLVLAFAQAHRSGARQDHNIYQDQPPAAPVAPVFPGQAEPRTSGPGSELPGATGAEAPVPDGSGAGSAFPGASGTEASGAVPSPPGSDAVPVEAQPGSGSSPSGQ